MGSMAMIHLVTIFASILMLSQAMPNREDVDRLLERLQQSEAREAAAYEDYAHNARNLDALGGGNLIRDTRGMDSLAGITFGGSKRFDSRRDDGLSVDRRHRKSGSGGMGRQRRSGEACIQQWRRRCGATFGGQRRRLLPSDHFYQPKRVNFDEIDHAGFVGFQKRTNFDEIDHAGFAGFQKRTNFDEIDHSNFDSLIKRSNPGEYAADSRTGKAPQMQLRY